MLNFCDSKGYALTSRIKTIESLAEKIETGRFKKWSELDDLIAPTIQDNEHPETKRKRQIAVATQELFDTEKIPEELKPKDMTRFCENLYGILTRAEKEDKVQEVIKCIKKKVNSTPSNQIPRSISLLQYFLAILVEAEIIILPLDKYYFHITSELIALYPIFRDSVNFFQYDI